MHTPAGISHQELHIGEVHDSGLRSGADGNNGGLCSANGNVAGLDLDAAAPRASGVTASSSALGYIGDGKDSDYVDANSKSGGAATRSRNAGSMHGVLLNICSIPFARFKMTATVRS